MQLQQLRQPLLKQLQRLHLRAAAPAGAQGAVKVNAPMPGKILKVNATAGAAVKKGDVLVGP